MPCSEIAVYAVKQILFLSKSPKSGIIQHLFPQCKLTTWLSFISKQTELFYDCMFLLKAHKWWKHFTELQLLNGIPWKLFTPLNSHVGDAGEKTRLPGSNSRGIPVIAWNAACHNEDVSLLLSAALLLTAAPTDWKKRVYFAFAFFSIRQYQKQMVLKNILTKLLRKHPKVMSLKDWHYL